MADFDLTMGLAGCRSVAEIGPEAPWRPRAEPEQPPQVGLDLVGASSSCRHVTRTTRHRRLEAPVAGAVRLEGVRGVVDGAAVELA